MPMGSISDSTLQAVDQIFADAAAAHRAPAVNYAVSVDGKLVHARATGLRVVEPPVATDPSTAFRIASMTKSFAAAAILALRDEKALPLDLPLRTIAPQLKLSATLQKFTVRQLLSMRTGLTTDDPWADRELPSGREVMDAIFARPVLTYGVPDESFQYSNLGYMLLGRIISLFAGEESLRFIIRRFCEPLGLSSTAWNHQQLSARNVAQGYLDRDGTWELQELLASGSDAAVFGGLWSSLADVARWTHFLAASECAESAAFEKILKAASRRELVEGCLPAGTSCIILHGASAEQAAFHSYGFGIGSTRIGDTIFYGHSGGLPGFGSRMSWHVGSRIAVVALANATYAPVGAPCAVALELLVRQSGQPEHPVPELLVEHVHKLVRLLNEWDDSLADEIFQTNLFLDTPRSTRRKQFAETLAALGPPCLMQSILFHRGYRAELTIRGSAGEALLRCSFSPAEDWKIQVVTITLADPAAQTVQPAPPPRA